MSRIGKKPITIPAGVEVKLEDKHLTVKGPKGTLERDIHPSVDVKVEGNVITVSVDSEESVDSDVCAESVDCVSVAGVSDEPQAVNEQVTVADDGVLVVDGKRMEWTLPARRKELSKGVIMDEKAWYEDLELLEELKQVYNDTDYAFLKTISCIVGPGLHADSAVNFSDLRFRKGV